MLNIVHTEHEYNRYTWRLELDMAGVLHGEGGGRGRGAACPRALAAAARAAARARALVPGLQLNIFLFWRTKFRVKL